MRQGAQGWDNPEGWGGEGGGRGVQDGGHICYRLLYIHMVIDRGMGESIPQKMPLLYLIMA